MTCKELNQLIQENKNKRWLSHHSRLITNLNHGYVLYKISLAMSYMYKYIGRETIFRNLIRFLSHSRYSVP